MGGVFELLKQIFGLNKTETRIIYTINEIIKKCFDKSLAKISCHVVSCSVKQVTFDDFKLYISDINEGVGLSTGTFNGKMIMGCFYGAALIDALYRNYVDKNTEISYQYFLGISSDKLSKILSHSVKSDNKVKYDEIYNFIKPFDHKITEELYWSYSDFVTYKIEFDNNIFYLLINPGPHSRLIKNLKNYPDLSEIFVSIIKSGFIKDNEEIKFINYDIPADNSFPVGRFFLPDKLDTDEFKIRTKFLATMSGISYMDIINNLGIWLLLKLKNGSHIRDIIYYFDVESIKNFEAEYGEFKKFILTITNYVVSYNKEKLNIDDLNAVVKLGGNVDQRLLMSYDSSFKTKMKINGKSLNCRVLFKSSFINEIVELFIPAKYLKHLEYSLLNIISQIITLNDSLFAKHFFSEINKMLSVDDLINSVYVSSFPFTQYMDLIDDKDLSLIIQNYLLVNFSIGEIKNLFHYTVEVSAGDNEATCVCNEESTEYDSFRFRRCLSDARVEDFDTCVVTGNLERHLILNSNVMNGIYEAAQSKKLLISGKARHLLRKLFYEMNEVNYINKINEITNCGFILSKLLNYNESEVSIIVNRYNMDDLALIIIAYKGKADYLKNYLSDIGQKELEYRIKKFNQEIKGESMGMKDLFEALLRIDNETWLTGRDAT